MDAPLSRSSVEIFAVKAPENERTAAHHGKLMEMAEGQAPGRWAAYVMHTKN
jgi:hypothetical protein